MAKRVPMGLWTLMWALGLLASAAVLGLAPAYLIAEAPRLVEGGTPWMQLSPGGLREVLVALHLLFLGGMVLFAVFPAAARLAGRMTGLAIVLGILEMFIAGAGVFLAEGAHYAPPQMVVSALGALLLLGGLGLNLDGTLRWLRSPKTPAVLLFAAAGLFALVCYALIGLLNTRYYARIDYTRAGRYTLPAPTERLLEALDTPVRISTVLTGNTEAEHILRREVVDMLDEYARTSARIEVRHINLAADPKAATELAERLQENKLTLERNAVVFECPANRRVMQVPAHEILQSVQGDAGGQIHRFMGDAVFHQALAVVTKQRPIKVYFVIGHGEKPQAVGQRPQGMSQDEYEKKRLGFGYDFFIQELRRRYYDLDVLDLERLDPDAGIPEDCDVLVIAGPWYARIAESWRSDMTLFAVQHAQRVREYLKRGGRVLAMIDPVGPAYRPAIAPLLELLQEHGVAVDVNHVVYDQRLIQEAGPYGERVARSEPSLFFSVNFIRDYATDGPDGRRSHEVHPSVRALGPLPLIAIESAEVKTAEASGLRHTRLLVTSDNAWLRPQPMPGRPESDGNPDDRRRRTLGVAVEKEDTGEPVMVVLGSSNLFIQGVIRFNNFARNDELGLKLLAWLAGSEQELAVEPRPTEQAFGHVAAGDIRAMRLVIGLVLPSIFIVLGAVIRIGRRR